MKRAIMQLYLFSYLGYLQFIRAVDASVVYDDVNYIMSAAARTPVEAVGDCAWRKSSEMICFFNLRIDYGF